MANNAAAAIFVVRFMPTSRRRLLQTGWPERSVIENKLEGWQKIPRKFARPLLPIKSM
jgi:hypothetical protein